MLARGLYPLDPQKYFRKREIFSKTKNRRPKKQGTEFPHGKGIAERRQTYFI